MRPGWEVIQANALAFAKRWRDGWDEKSEAQSFVRDFLAVFGIEDAASVGRFEERARREGGRGFMDYFWAKKIAVEMKSRGRNLAEALAQAKDYVIHLDADKIPDLIMVSDFETILLYRRATGEKKQFRTKDLHRHVRRFAALAGYEASRDIEDQEAVNVVAAGKMAKLHDALKSYGYEGHDLEVYLVRLLFCLFADDTGIFPRQKFLDYVENSKPDGSDLSARIGKLFDVLNMGDGTRAKRGLLSEDLKAFCYVNGGLFSATLPMAEFNAKMRAILLECCRFDWGGISPAIFGAMFQGVMDEGQRRELGAHYTSEENILKLIKPLFMDDLWLEFERVKASPILLEGFHERIAGLKFLDPACGCGNFLIIAYRELRRLELEVLRMKAGGQKVLDIASMLKVNVGQFYGIESEDFPCQIAEVGMWLMDHQMNLRVSEQFGQYYARLPLTQSATIVHGNALRIDWEEVVPKHELSYILGNPPFVGYSNQSEEQKADILSVYVDGSGKPFKNAGKIDYVAAWYYKAAEYMVGRTPGRLANGDNAADRQTPAATRHPLLKGGETPASFEANGLSQMGAIRAAFVSTNSITQGEQVAAVWKPLFEMFGVRIDFCYRTFKWSNEAKGKAAVHCVIVGFSPSLLSHSTQRNAAKGEKVSSPISHSAQRGDFREAAVLSPLFKGGGGEAVGGLSGSNDAVGGLPDFDGAAKDLSGSYAAAKGSPTDRDRVIYDSDGTRIPARNINPYLLDAPDIFVESRKTPLCDIPPMLTGNRPADGGHLIIEDEDLANFIKADPLSEKHIRRFMGSEEFINNKKRWCLWLLGVPPEDLRRMPEVMKRIAACKKDRENSPDAGRRKLAATPMLFREQATSKLDYIVVPKVSSERRSYVPIGFVSATTIASDLLFLIPESTLYHFAILTGGVHMAWMRAVCGRLEMRYRYSKDIVYNNFPWPDASNEQKANIEKLAQAILDARALFPDSSLADLYDPLTMPPNLLKAHNNLDRAVMKLYGFAKDMTEAEIVAALMERYKKLVER
ncbi:MAG: class I SAM-dependent DNA methyltransferase [Betaproteobacteria bacterium]|nr:class I SAM-dependent DNA methyltransferase [Betaproteobacteria bacterium]